MTYQQISPTAYMTNYWRAIYGVEPAQRMLEMLPVNSDAINYAMEYVKRCPLFTSQFAARYLLTKRLIRQYNAPNVVELAAGFSTHCLEETTERDVRFYDIDLPEVVAQKQKILTTFDKLNERILCCALNCVFNDSLQFVYAHTQQSRVTVCNEGFMLYLNFNEKQQVARNVHTCLVENGGVWINCDITLPIRGEYEHEWMDEFDRLSNEVGKPIGQNLFMDCNHARRWFQIVCGFSVEEHRMSEVVDELDIRGFCEFQHIDYAWFVPQVKQFLDQLYVYILRVA